MLYTHAGELPRHIDCFVDDVAVLREPTGEVLPCRWFGLTSHPGRVWGCTVLLECGAVYRDVPPHMIAFHPKAAGGWTVRNAQRWDCYSRQFTTIEYAALAGLRCVVECHRVTPGQPASGLHRELGRYLFTAAPFGDGYTQTPEQGKEFCFVATDGGRLTIQPTDKLAFRDPSFTETVIRWPTGLKRSDTVYSCEV